MSTKITIGVIILILIGILLFLNYVGFFSKVVIEEKEAGPFVLIYEDHLGPYKGTAKIQDDIYHSLLEKVSIETYRGFGIYYDNPKEVPKDELRSIAGCILEEKDYDKLDAIMANGYKIKRVISQKAIGTEFPFKNSLSIFAGIFRVYPALEKHSKENNIPNSEIMEIYDIPNKKITYLMKI